MNKNILFINIALILLLFLGVYSAWHKGYQEGFFDGGFTATMQMTDAAAAAEAEKQAVLSVSGVVESIVGSELALETRSESGELSGEHRIVMLTAATAIERITLEDLKDAPLVKPAALGDIKKGDGIVVFADHDVKTEMKFTATKIMFSPPNTFGKK